MRRLAVLLAAVAAVTACDLQRFSPGDKCWYRYTAFRIATDTVMNETPLSAIPDSMKQYWRPFILFKREIATDSVRECR